MVPQLAAAVVEIANIIAAGMDGEIIDRIALAYQLSSMKPYQIASIFCEERYAIIEASTKSGKTHGCIAWLFNQASIGGAPGRNYWWVAPVYSQAEEAYRRMKLAIPIPFRKANNSNLSLIIPNGATIWFKTGEKPDNLYGADVYAAVIDEGSRFREEAWYAIRSTLTATRGPVRIIGNVKGKKNWFYAIARAAEAGEPNMHYARITADDAVAAGVLQADEILDAKKRFTENVFKELYMAEPSDDGGNPFGQEYIDACVAPLSVLDPVVFGVDLAKSVDHTVIIGLDIKGYVCFFKRFQKPWKETIETIIDDTKEGRVLIDSTGVGDPIVEGLQRDEGDNDAQFESFKFTSESKQRIMEGLAVAIQRQNIHYPEGVIKSELEIFEYEYTRTGVKYSAPEGFHDDCVCALALAWSMYTTAHGFKPSAALAHNRKIISNLDTDESQDDLPDWMGGQG